MIHVMFYLFFLLSLLQVDQQTDQPTPQQIMIAMDSGDLDIERLIECLADGRSVHAAMPFDASVARFAEDTIVSRGKSALAPLCNWMNSQQGNSLQRRHAVSAIRRIVDEEACPVNAADTLLVFVAKEDEDYEARVMALSFLSRSSERIGAKACEDCFDLLNSNDPNLRGLSLIVLARGGYENQIVLQAKIESLLEESSVRHRDTSRYGVLLPVERPLRLDAIRAYGLSPLDSEEVNLRLKKWFLQENQRLAAECGVALLQKRQLTTHQLRDLLDVLEVFAIEEFHGGFNDEQHERLVFNDFVFECLEKDLKLDAESLAAFDLFSKYLLKDERCERRWGTLLIARRNLGLPLIHDVAFRCSKSGFEETSIPAFRVLLKDLKFESTLCSDWVTFLEQHEYDDLEGTVRILEYLNTDESQAFLSELLKRSHRFRSVYETMKKGSDE